MPFATFSRTTPLPSFSIRNERYSIASTVLAAISRLLSGVSECRSSFLRHAENLIYGSLTSLSIHHMSAHLYTHKHTLTNTHTQTQTHTHTHTHTLTQPRQPSPIADMVRNHIPSLICAPSLYLYPTGCRCLVDSPLCCHPMPQGGFASKDFDAASWNTAPLEVVSCDAQHDFATTRKHVASWGFVWWSASSSRQPARRLFHNQIDCAQSLIIPCPRLPATSRFL